MLAVLGWQDEVRRLVAGAEFCYNAPRREGFSRIDRLQRRSDSAPPPMSDGPRKAFRIQG
jgi:hypothetical protein